MESDILTQKIIGAAIEVHRTLGPGLLESIYEEAFCHEFDLRGIRYRRQVEIDVIYKDKVIKGQRLDILVEEEVIVEIKSLSKLAEVSIAQVLSYLKATGLKRALISTLVQKCCVRESDEFLYDLCVLCGKPFSIAY